MSSRHHAAPRRRKHARPQELLDAGLELFVEKGFASVRTEELAARAGVSKGTLYLYYPSKQDLFKAVIAGQAPSRLDAWAGSTICAAETSADRLRHLLRLWWSELAVGPAGGVVKLVITEARTFPEIAEVWVRRVIEPGQILVRQVVQQGMDAGEFRRLEPDVVVGSLVLPMLMLCVHRHTVGACDSALTTPNERGFFEEHIELVIEGLIQRAPALRPRTSGAKT